MAGPLRARIDHFIDLTRPADGLEPYTQVAQEQGGPRAWRVRWEHHPIVAFAGNQPETVSEVRLDTGPACAEELLADAVDLVVLTPV